MLWLTLILVCFGILVFQIVDRIVYYYSWPVTVNLKVNFNKTLNFPAVTICNQNSFKASLATDLGRYRLYEAMFTSGGPVNTSYIFEHGGNITLDDLYLAAAQQKEEFIFGCTWKGRECGPDDFVTSLTDHGVCYTWNRQLDEYAVSSPGVSNGLRLKINIEQNEYMPGPHSSAGVKFLLHEAKEVPLVHALGQAVSPGYHVFVSVTLTEINNLREPYGKCSHTDLEYVTGYSQEACKLNCLSKISDQVCGCRHIYMPYSNGKPEVCTVKQYYNCLKNVITTFPSVWEDKCHCPVPCLLYRFENDISYGRISKFAVNHFFNKNNTANLTAKLIEANEVTSRMDLSKLEELHELAEQFEEKLEDIEQLFVGKLDNQIHDVAHALEDEFNHISWICEWKTFVYEYQHYIVQKNFVRPRDAMEERHAHIVALAYTEFILSIEQKIRYLINMDQSDQSLRTFIYTDTLNVIDNRKELIQRAITNYTSLIQAYSSGKGIFNYRYENVPRYHNKYIVPVGLLQESINLNNVTRENVDLYTIYLFDTINILERITNLTHEVYNNTTLNESSLESTVNDYNEVMLNWLSVRQTVYYEVIERPLRILSDEIDEFKQMCFSHKTHVVSITKKIEALDRKIEGVKSTLFVPLKRMHDIIHSYVVDGIGSKYGIAQNFTSGDILLGKANLETLIYELMTGDFTFIDILSDMNSLSIQIHRKVVEDYNSFPYYNFTGNFQFMRNFSEVQKEIEYNYTTYVENIHFYDVVGQDGFHFSQSVVELVSYFRKYLETLQLDENYVKDNFAQLDIFYRQMNYEEITQQVAFDTFALFCDIGGSMGLFLGASLLSLCELLDLIWTNVFKVEGNDAHRTVIVTPVDASLQNEQFKNLVSNLTLGSCVCLHDFSENYRCSELQELQSTYCQKTEVSTDVAVIHRHAMLEYDGIDRNEENPNVITEHFYVISPDQQHDHEALC